MKRGPGRIRLVLTSGLGTGLKRLISNCAMYLEDMAHSAKVLAKIRRCSPCELEHLRSPDPTGSIS